MMHVGLGDPALEFLRCVRSNALFDTACHQEHPTKYGDK